MSWKVLVSAHYLQPVIDRFRDAFDENDMVLVLPSVKERLIVWRH